MTNTRISRGNVVIGVMLMLIGGSLLLDRTGLDLWDGRWSLWPIILVGIGVARLVQSWSGGPIKGLMPIAAGAWLFAVQGGWLALETSWPLLVVALGVAIAVSGVVRRPPAPGTEPSQWNARHSFGPLAVLGIWVAFLIAGFPHGVVRSTPQADGSLHIFQMMGNSQAAAPTGEFHKAEVTNVMARSELDLTKAHVQPGDTVEVTVFSMMGRVVLHVPFEWDVDVSTRTVAGEVKNSRRAPKANAEALPATPAGPAVRLKINGVVAMGNLDIRN